MSLLFSIILDQAFVTIKQVLVSYDVDRMHQAFVVHIGQGRMMGSSTLG